VVSHYLPCSYLVQSLPSPFGWLPCDHITFEQQMLGTEISFPICLSLAAHWRCSVVMPMQKSTNRKFVTIENFSFKLGIHDYVVDITCHATFGSNQFSGGCRPNGGNITLVTFT